MRHAFENVWLGTFEDAKNSEALSGVAIKAILNVAHEHDTPQSGRAVSFKVGIFEDDRETNPVLEAVELLEMLSRRYGRVLVHCHACMNRSPFVVALWLALKRYIPFFEAITLTRVDLHSWMDKWIERCGLLEDS
jgi:hypothetical protein